jgi:hypothetical protein
VPAALPVLQHHSETGMASKSPTASGGMFARACALAASQGAREAQLVVDKLFESVGATPSGTVEWEELFSYVMSIAAGSIHNPAVRVMLRGYGMEDDAESAATLRAILQAVDHSKTGSISRSEFVLALAILSIEKDAVMRAKTSENNFVLGSLFGVLSTTVIAAAVAGVVWWKSK